MRWRRGRIVEGRRATFDRRKTWRSWQRSPSRDRLLDWAAVDCLASSLQGAQNGVTIGERQPLELVAMDEAPLTVEKGASLLAVLRAGDQETRLKVRQAAGDPPAAAAIVQIRQLQHHDRHTAIGDAIRCHGPFSAARNSDSRHTARVEMSLHAPPSAIASKHAARAVAPRAVVHEVLDRLPGLERAGAKLTQHHSASQPVASTRHDPGKRAIRRRSRAASSARSELLQDSESYPQRPPRLTESSRCFPSINCLSGSSNA